MAITPQVFDGFNHEVERYSLLTKQCSILKLAQKYDTILKHELKYKQEAQLNSFFMIFVRNIRFFKLISFGLAVAENMIIFLSSQESHKEGFGIIQFENPIVVLQYIQIFISFFVLSVFLYKQFPIIKKIYVDVEIGKLNLELYSNQKYTQNFLEDSISSDQNEKQIGIFY